MNWIAQHLGASLSLTTLLAGAVGFLAHRFGPFVQKMVDLELVKGLDHIKSPKLKAICLEVDAVVEKHIPDAGDQKYTMLAALVMSELPPEAAPAQPLVLALLTAIGTGARAGIEDAEAQEAAQAAKATPGASSAAPEGIQTPPVAPASALNPPATP